jgi:lysophospholipid acyltransferase (LPLAT)-like uncharacterized protein
MRIHSTSGVSLAAFGLSRFIKTWLQTLDVRVSFYDRAVDPAESGEPRRIYLFWHEHILLPIFLRGHCDIVTLMSQHRDADVLAKLAKLLGFGCVRGSTYRGGSQALKQLVDIASRAHIGMTPDGPRGPRRKMASGAIFLASKLGMPIVPMGFGFDRPWRLASWDRFAVPRPLTRARAVVGPAIDIPPRLQRKQIEEYRLAVEQVLNHVTEQAEAWAAAGVRLSSEAIVRPQCVVRSAKSSDWRFQLAGQ